MLVLKLPGLKNTDRYFHFKYQISYLSWYSNSRISHPKPLHALAPPIQPTWLYSSLEPPPFQDQHLLIGSKQFLTTLQVKLTLSLAKSPYKMHVFNSTPHLTHYFYQLINSCLLIMTNKLYRKNLLPSLSNCQKLGKPMPWDVLVFCRPIILQPNISKSSWLFQWEIALW